MSRKLVTFVEIDLPVCSLTYGVTPCAASGGPKCFNSIKTCQDRENFDETTTVMRYAVASDYLVEAGIDAIASIESVQLAPAVVSLGENLGIRASLTLNFRDHRHPDTGPGHDPYVRERGYDPYGQGTYWGRLRARHPFLRGRPIRLIRGYVGQSLAEMETRHFIIEAISGPSADGRFTVNAKDILKLADGDRAQAPRPSNGYLVGAIAAGTTTATLTPAGIGNKEYPTSGIAAIGGNEVVTFTRSGDVLSLGRGQFGTAAVAHDAQDRVQVCLRYVAQDPADIARDLFVNYADVPASTIPLADWQAETGSHLRRVYTALIAEPTSVNKLVSELVTQAALAIWWDDRGQLLRLHVLRQIETNAVQWGDEAILAGSLSIREQPDKRISQVWVYFGMIDPTGDVEDPSNYRSLQVTVATDDEADNGSAAIKKIYSRWIPAFGRSVADRLGQVVLARFRVAPRRFTFDLFAGQNPLVGGGYRLNAEELQTDTGARDQVPMQITSLGVEPGRQRVEAEELNYAEVDEEDLANRGIIIDGNAFNLNLRDIHDSLYPAIRPGDTVKFIVNEGVVVGSVSPFLPAVNAGIWPELVPTLDVRGRIAGAGGWGGKGKGGDDNPGGWGNPGGTGLYVRDAIILTGTGVIAGGGGGGGGGGGDWAGWFGPQRNGGGGGGGAGAVPGGGGGSEAAGAGGAGSLHGGGNGGGGDHWGGGGGGPGAAGGWSWGEFNAPGGAGGWSVDGNSHVTRTGWTGSMLGVAGN